MLRGPRIIVVPLYIFCILTCTSFLLEQFYSFPQSHPSLVPTYLLALVPLGGFLFVECIGFMLLGQMWWWRDYLLTRYGPLAYQRILFIGLAGITVVIFLAFNSFTSVVSLSPQFWQSTGFSFLVTPWFSVDYHITAFIRIVRLFLGCFFLLLGLSLSLRTIHTFGIDYTTALYLYFPAESSVQEHQIYSLLRHPMYTGLIFITFGGFLFNLSLYSFFYFVLYVFGFYFHIHFVEEPELHTRFGESYQSYCHQVPAFFQNPGKFFQLLKFIIAG